MVHARAFSFTDDSMSVAYPSAAGVTNASAIGNPLTGPHSLESALLLFQLRYTQSCWYQELFQSSRDPLQNSSMYLWQIFNEMRDWSESTESETLPLAFKDFFDLELLYSYVYCLAPSCRVQAVSAYGKTLIFEYSIAYMQKIFPISKDPINKAFYTYHDALRVYFVGSQFVAVLTASQDQEQLLTGIIPFAPVMAGSPPPPPLPPRSNGSDNFDRSINCMTHIRETLKTFGHRWEDSQALLRSFESQAEPLLAVLQQRKEPFDGSVSTRHNTSPPPFVQQSSFELLGGTSGEDWQNMGSPYASSANLQQG